MSKKGYWMAMVDVTDPENYPKYIAANKAAFDKYGAKFLVRGGQAPESWKDRPATRLVVHRVRVSYETALDCYPLARIPGGAEAAAGLFDRRISPSSKAPEA